MNKFLAKDLKNVDFISSLYDAFISISKKCDELSSHDFFKEISKIIFNYSLVSCRQNTNLNDKQLTKIKECLLIAVRLFDEACEENNWEKLLISLRIFDFFDQNYGLIKISKISKDLKNKIVGILKTTDFEINVLKNAQYHEKRMVEILHNAKMDADYSQIINIFDIQICHSGAFYYEKSTWGFLINFAFYLDKKIMLDVLDSTDDYEKTELFLSSLEKEFFCDMSFASELKNNYLVLRVFKYWLLSLEDKYWKFNKLEEIPDYTDYLTSMFLNSNLHLENYIEILRISHLKSYNYLLGRLVALHENFLHIYLNHISFGKDETQAFSLGFLEKTDCSADNVVTNTIEQIKSKFLAHEIHSYSNINSGTGFLDLFFYYFRIKNPDRNAYLKTLAEYSEKILSEQNSCNHEAVTSVWVDLYYFCLSNIVGKYVFSENELRTVIPALFDERNEMIYDIKSLNAMRTLLMTPNKQIKIKIKPYVLLQYLIEVEEEEMITKEIKPQ